MTDKKPVPPSLAQFALEQLAETSEQAAIDLTVQNVEILRAEVVKRDARIAELDENLDRMSAHRDSIARTLNRVIAELEDTESRRANAARNASAFEARMGDLQVENGKLGSANEKLTQRIKDLKTVLAALKAQQPSAGVVDDRAAFEAWMHTYDLPPILDGEIFNDPNYPDAYFFGEFVYDDHSTQRCWAAWQANTRLNPCRAQAVQVNHDSDCSTNNHGVPELLGPCDCSASKDK